MDKWEHRFGYDKKNEPWRWGRPFASFAERVVWDYKKGDNIELHPLQELTGNKEDKGLFGVHVTSDPERWLCVLRQDYSRLTGTPFILTIKQNTRLFLIDDPNVVDVEAYPPSLILVSEKPVIKASEVVKIVDASDIECPDDDNESGDEDDSGEPGY